MLVDAMFDANDTFFLAYTDKTAMSRCKQDANRLPSTQKQYSVTCIFFISIFLFAFAVPLLILRSRDLQYIKNKLTQT